MKIFFTVTLCCALNTYAFADVEIADLPHLEGTPITAAQTDGTFWTLLDSGQPNNTVQWAWLERLGGKAYVLYPTDTPTITFPDGRIFTADSQSVSIYFIDLPRVEFTRFGGKVVLEGTEVSVQYSINSAEAKQQGNHYELTTHTVRIEGVNSAKLTTTGTIPTLYGTPFNDTFSIGTNSSVLVDGAGGEDKLIPKFDSGGPSGGGCPSPSAEIATLSSNNKPCPTPLVDIHLEPENGSLIVPPQANPTVSLEPAENTADNKGGKSKGGSIDWALIAGIAALLFRKGCATTQNFQLR